MQIKGPQSNTLQKDSEKQYSSYFRAALIRGPEFYKYENYEIPINKQGQQNYEIIKKIGRGKYSDVFKCINVHDDKFYVLKILKPVRQQKIKREIKILNSLDHPNIIKMHEILFDEVSKCNCLVFLSDNQVFDFVKVADFRDLIDVVGPNDIRKIMYQILQGLKYCHSKGIVHRDIKPQNILIDQDTLTVKISDWGLAEYYLPNTEFNVRVASRHYKGPELLLNNRNYDFSLDIWSLGLVFAGLLFRTHTIFRGDNNPDQLNQIMKHFGLIEIKEYISKYKLVPDEQTQKFIDQCKRTQKRSWNYYFQKQNRQLCEEVALDLLDKMLQIDHKKRINVIDALNHQYFSQIRT